MFRVLVCLLVVVVTGPRATAQMAQPGDPIRLTIGPAALPSPSLKYHLLPDRRDQVHGNAAALYYRALAGLFENNALYQDLKEDHWYLWATMPLKDLPRQEVRERLGLARSLLHEVEVAGTCRQCDWNLEGRSEGLGLLLPEVQGYRKVGTVVAARARYEIAEGNLLQALQTLQAGYALVHNLGKGPTFIHILVGAAIAQLLNSQLDELVQQPGAPSLYWALAVLPRPFFDFESALQEEGVMLENMWPTLKRLENGPMSPGQVQALQQDIQRTLDGFQLRRPSVGETVGQTLMQMGAYPDARKGLLAQGMTASQVEAMPPLQVLALYALRQYRQTWEEYIKWMRVPRFWQQEEYKKAARNYQEAATRIDLLLLRGLLGALGGSGLKLERIYAAGGRTDRRFAALRCVEALRLYAAAHEGRLPAKLADITEVPVPDDPLTAKPFEYEASGDRAKLTAPGAPGEPYQKLVYELTLRR